MDRSATRGSGRGRSTRGALVGCRWWRLAWAAVVGVLLLVATACQPGAPDGSSPETSSPDAAPRGAASPSAASGWTTYVGFEPRALAPAADGGVWMGTSGNGLVRWDASGASYERYPLPDGRGGSIESMTVAADGAVWVATRSGDGPVEGLLRFDDGQWTTPPGTQRLPGSQATAVAAAPDGSVWAATAASIDTPHGAVSRFDGQQWTSWTGEDGLIRNEHVDRVAVEDDGTVWAHTSTGRGRHALSRFDGQAWTSWPAEQVLPTGRVNSMAAGNGAVWLTVRPRRGSSPPTLVRFDGREAATWRVDIGLSADDEVESLVVADGGTVWAATDQGAWRFDGDDWHRASRGLGDKPVDALAAGDEGGVWAATLGQRNLRGRLSRFADGQWGTWATYTGSPSTSHLAVAADEGVVWVPTVGAGILRFDGQRWRRHTTAEGLAHDGVMAAAAQGSTVWALTADLDALTSEASDAGEGAHFALSRFDDGQWTTPAAGDGPSDALEALVVADAGTVWAATDDGGVARFDGDWTTWGGGDGFLGSIGHLAVGADDTVWAASGNNEAIYRFHGGQWRTVSGASPIPGDAVTSLAAGADGALWVGTHQGLAHFDGTGWRTVTAADGLPANRVSAVTVADDGTVWVTAGRRHGPDRPATAGGVAAFTGQSWTSWTTEDGLAGGWARSVTVGGDGTVWVATKEGLSRFIPP